MLLKNILKTQQYVLCMRQVILCACALWCWMKCDVRKVIKRPVMCPVPT